MRKLSTSCFSVHYDKGSVRWIKNNGTEILRMVYSAVRDHNWGAIEPEMTDEKMEVDESGFRVAARMKYYKANIQFEACYTITGRENRLEFEMTGEAKSSFLTNRVGFCVLHPIAEIAGKPCTVIHPGETSEKILFPELISPDQPLKNISALEWEPAKNIRATLQFSGDVFEMEDQRNWTDASYKTYCRPLSLPFPYRINKGELIRQKVELALECPPDSKPENKVVTLRIDKERLVQIPAIGVQSTSRQEPLTVKEAEILSRFPFDHLRSEIHLFSSGWKTELARSTGESHWLGTPLFLVLYFSENHQEELAQLREAVSYVPVLVKYVLIVGKNHLTDDNLFEKVYSGIGSLFPEARIGAGVNAYFAELNRNRPSTEKADFISFSVCPQVHASDNVSLVENLEAQKYVVESAKNLFSCLPVFVSPVTMKQRFNVVATSEENDQETGELPPQVDARQPSLFAAQWLMGSLKYLAQSQADLVTFFETAGWRGFIQGDYDPPLCGKFQARKGDVFPVFQLLNELKGFDEIICCESNDPLKVEAMVLQKRSSGKMKMLVANFTGERQQLKIEPGYQNIAVTDIFTGNWIHVTDNLIVIEDVSIFKIEL